MSTIMFHKCKNLGLFVDRIRLIIHKTKIEQIMTSLKETYRKVFFSYAVD